MNGPGSPWTGTEPVSRLYLYKCTPQAPSSQALAIEPGVSSRDSLSGLLGTAGDHRSPVPGDASMVGPASGTET